MVLHATFKECTRHGQISDCGMSACEVCQATVLSTAFGLSVVQKQCNSLSLSEDTSNENAPIPPARQLLTSGPPLSQALPLLSLVTPMAKNWTRNCSADLLHRGLPGALHFFLPLQHLLIGVSYPTLQVCWPRDEHSNRTPRFS